MPKINPKKNLRDKDIEQALAEIYASSEDEGSEDEELSGSFPLYPPYDINQALDSIENITNSDLLEILQKDDSPSPKPFPPAAPPAKKLRLTCESSSPAVLVEALPSAVACQLVSPEVSQQQRTQKLRLTCESSSPAVLVEALPSAVACQLVSPEVSQQQRTQKLRLTCESSSPAVLVEALPSAVACQLVSPEVSQQPKSFAAAHQPLSSATVAQHSPPPAAQQVSSPAAAQQSSCPAAAHKPPPSETVHQASPPAAAQHPLPSAAVHQPSPSTSAYQPSPSTEAPRLSRSETVHQSSSSTADQSALLQELINKDRNWSNNTTRFPAHDFSRKLKSTKLYNNRSLPIDYFLNMFDNEIFTIIAENTNSYASFMHSLHWSPTDATEIRAYLGLVIMMGLHPLSELELYWSSDPFYHNPIISAVMTCKRFKKLTENLHINDKSTEIPRTQPGYDKLAKIRPVMNILNNSFQNNCIGSHTQAIDESMVKFKGKSVMKQYMPQKPIKRGYKVWARCDSESGYLYQFDVYCGKSETAEDGDGGLGYKVVMKLCREVGPNTLIVFDNFFTSLPLLEMLYFKNIFSVGTVRLNRKGLPPRLLPNKGDKKENKLKVGEFMFQHSDPVSVIKWKDTKDVYVCTTAYDPKAVVTIQRTQKDGQKASMTCPLAIEQYTRYMGGVDRFDHYRSSYSIGRKSTKKNWIRLFWFMLEAACINAYIVYSLTHKKTSSSHRDFRLSLSRSLIDNFTTRVRAPPIYKNKKGGFGVSDELRLNRVGIHMPCEGTRRRCRYCSTREKPQRSKIMCNLCQVPLCPAPCFANFHRYGEM